MLTLLLGIGCVSAQVVAGFDADRGDDPNYEDMIAARSTTSRTVAGMTISDVQRLYDVFALNGTKFSLATSTASALVELMPEGTGQLFQPLNFSNALVTPNGGLIETSAVANENSYNLIPLVNRSSNNLGGLGPNNGTYCYTRATISTPSYANCDPGNYQAHPNFIRLNDITVTSSGQRVAMRIDNTSDYKVAKPAMNDFNGFNFQINLQPLWNNTAGHPGDEDQPFKADTGGEFGSLAPVINSFIETALAIDLRAENSNVVSLFYSFFDQDTGLPIELEEFMISFYDFDQDHADGANAYLRESMYVTNFTSMFLTRDTSLTYEFASDIEERLQTANPGLAATANTVFTSGSLSHMYRGGYIPVTTFDEWDWSQDRRLSVHRPRGWDVGSWPPTNSAGYDATFMTAMHNMYDYSQTGGGSYNGPYTVSEARASQVFSSGVILRSTEQGTGPPMFPKSSWMACQGDCASGNTPAGTPCNMQTYTCNSNWNGVASHGACSGVDTRCGPANSRWAYIGPNGGTNNHMSRNTAHWTGCGFVNNAQPRFAPGAALTLSNAPNASIGQTAFFSYPPGCISNGPPSTYATATQVSGGGNYFATAGDPALYDDNVACIFDCPRTSVRDDYGNPVSESVAANTPQQRNRGVTFLFRNRQNFTVAYRTEIGSNVVAKMDADDPAALCSLCGPSRALREPA